MGVGSEIIDISDLIKHLIHFYNALPVAQVSALATTAGHSLSCRTNGRGRR